MPRYHVILSDTNTAEIDGVIVKARHPVHAILQHPWIADTYTEKYIQTNFAAEDEVECIQNIYNMTSWSVLCVNLDEAIMLALNAGDSSASSQTPQE